MILQTINTDAIAQKLSPDSLAVKNEAMMETLRNTPPDQLLQNLTSQAIQFGIKVLAALFIYAIGAWVIKLVRKGLRRSFTRRNAEKTLSTFTDSLVTIVLWIIVIVISVSTLGVNTTSLAALLAAGGMAIGMALSGTVQNFAGGIMILVFKPFKVGDFIEAQGFSGTVTEVNIVSTKIRTVDNRQVILPNGALSNGNINNVNALPLRRVDINVSVAYGTSAEKVTEALREIIAGVPQILDSGTPGAADPFTGLLNLGESSVNFVIRCWVKSEDYWNTYFALNNSIYTDLPAKYGIQFPFPQMDIHIKQ